VAQYADQLEKQADVLARIVAAGGAGSATDPRQGRIQPHRGGRATNTTPTFCERAPKAARSFI
jgi:hypothetical protein